MAPQIDSSASVFINCPFTDDYTTLFHAMVFTVLACGCAPRSALEQGDGGEVRMDKIIRLIKASPYSIHDLSATALDRINQLPRFNMPFELGLVLGLKAGGGKHASHRVLVLEEQRFVSQKCLSDIAGQDLQAHEGDVEKLIVKVRNWLRTETGRELPGPARITGAWRLFCSTFPQMCANAGIEMSDLPFPELLAMQVNLLKAQSAA